MKNLLCVTGDNDLYRVCYIDPDTGKFCDLGNGDFVENVTAYMEILELGASVVLDRTGVQKLVYCGECGTPIVQFAQDNFFHCTSCALPLEQSDCPDVDLENRISEAGWDALIKWHLEIEEASDTSPIEKPRRPRVGGVSFWVHRASCMVHRNRWPLADGRSVFAVSCSLLAVRC